MVFEVASSGNGDRDLIDKNREYRATASIRRYVILTQTRAAAIMFVRRDDDWLAEIVARDDAALSLPEIGIVVPLSEIYANVTLEARQEDPAPGHS